AAMTDSGVPALGNGHFATDPAGGMGNLSYAIREAVHAEAPPRNRNGRLRAAMADLSVTFDDLATVTGRNIKSVQRWGYEGRTPRGDCAAAVARYLDIPATWLWPKSRPVVNPELINLYADIAEVPPTVWLRSASDAQQTIEIAAELTSALPSKLVEVLQAK